MSLTTLEQYIEDILKPESNFEKSIENSAIILHDVLEVYNHEGIERFAEAVFLKARNSEVGAARNSIYYYLINSYKLFIQENIKNLLKKGNNIGYQIGTISTILITLTKIKERIIDNYINEGDYITVIPLAKEYFGNGISIDEWRAMDKIHSDKLSKYEKGSIEWLNMIKTTSNQIVKKLINIDHINPQDFNELVQYIIPWLDLYHSIDWENIFEEKN